MAYSSIIKPSAFMNTKLYAGNGGTNAQTGVGFQPNWVWLKQRGGSAASHKLYDSVRGTTKYLASNNNGAEATDSNGLTAFGTDGFTVGSSAGTNANGQTYVGWNWKAGTSFTNDASGTGIGSIDSAGSVSTTAGFSIISWTGSGSAATIAHGLGLKLNMYIVKNRSDSGEDWIVYHGANTSAPETDYIMLNEANATGDSSGVWNDTAPTSSVFSVGTANSTNGSSKNMIAYCFADVKGYSKFGGYSGNGNANGTFVYTGFKPAFVMVKITNAANDWIIMDNKRTPFNPMGEELKPNTNGASSTNTRWDQLSNGFKFRDTGDAVNGSGKNYIYMAFAEEPFVASNFNAATAR